MRQSTETFGIMTHRFQNYESYMRNPMRKKSLKETFVETWICGQYRPNRLNYESGQSLPVFSKIRIFQKNADDKCDRAAH